MSILQSYSEYLKTGNIGSMASLFAEDGHFYDEAPAKLGLQAISLEGRSNIEAFFTGVFKQGGLDITNVAINGNAMRYDVKIGDTVLLALGVVKEENGLIKEYIVTVA